MFNLKLREGFVLAVSSCLCGAFVSVILRYVLKSGDNPLNVTTWIILFMLLPWLFLFKRHVGEFRRLSRKTLSLLIFIGIAGSIGVNYMQSLALAHTTAINFSFLYRTIIVFTIIFAWLFLKEKLTWRKIVLVMLIVLGSFLITTNGQSFTLSQGDIYTLIMAATAAFVSNILIKHTMSKMHTDLSGSVISIVSCSSLVTLAVSTGVFTFPIHYGWVFLASLCYFGLIMFRNRAYKVSTASFVTMVFGLTPFFVTILSFIFLHETIGPIEMLGGALIIGSTFLAEKHKI